jgi:cytoskeletal protein RodZ
MVASRPGPGSLLRAARESRGLTIAEVAQETKIPAGSLQAIDEDRLADLPGSVFARGFVKAYARAVGLDGPALVRATRLLVSPDGDSDDGKGAMRRARPRSFSRTRAGQLLVAALALAMLIAAWAMVGARDTDPPGTVAVPDRVGRPAPTLRSPAHGR